MTALEIVLLILGSGIFVASFVLPEKKKELNESEKQLTKEQIQEMMQEEMKQAKQQVSDVIEETVSYSVEKTERALERITNDKLQAITEYSGTVLSDIHKNHEETVFLYDMLNSKHENLKETASEVSQAVKEANEAVSEAEQTTQEAIEATQALDEAVQNATNTEFVPMNFSSVEHVEAEDALEQILLEEIDEALLEDTEKVENEKPVEKKATTRKPAQKNTSRAKSQTKSRTRKKADHPSDVNISFDLVKDGSNQNSNDRILELHKAGKSNIAIAKELGLGVGEVKLVIDLFDSVGQL